MNQSECGGPSGWGAFDQNPLKPSEVFHGRTVYARTDGPLLEPMIGRSVSEAERVVEERKGPWL